MVSSYVGYYRLTAKDKPLCPQDEIHAAISQSGVRVLNLLSIKGTNAYFFDTDKPIPFKDVERILDFLRNRGRGEYGFSQHSSYIS